MPTPFTIHDPVFLLIALVYAHFLMDYPFQGPFLSAAKNRNTPTPNFPWWHAMLAHSVLQGGAVALLTGIWWLGVLEAAIHWAVDEAKCDNAISINTDQIIHLTCKVVWWLIAVSFPILITG